MQLISITVSLVLALRGVLIGALIVMPDVTFVCSDLALLILECIDPAGQAAC